MAAGDEQNVTSDGGVLVVKHEPTLRDAFHVFARFRQEKNYDGLIQYLITTYPKNVKNRTFNFSGGGHVFHMLYAYVPLVSTKERKQIRLDFIDRLMTKTSNDFKLYEDVIKLMGDKNLDMCPCELINARLQDNISYNNNLLNKHFDVKPAKLKKEPIDALLSKNSINWKQSLRKKKMNLVKKNKTVTTPTADSASETSSAPLSVDGLTMKPSKLQKINGQTVESCKHSFVVVEKQLRAGDEAVSFVRVCKLCKVVDV
ncbi:LEF-5 [Betabaculovirus altermyunipunctae]|uniref:LEF-5 n=1 Tax=Betabaculovirus altermyunipunctae TaxID=3051996 RepID=A0A1S5YE67_9BBAC|nr:LEF-5 [Betabaculovirus altermyunipunctae]AQQ80356.1 LEF-5 [Betabaculovirus altermyunipunctae]